MRAELLQKLVLLLKDNKFGAALLVPSASLIAIDFVAIWYNSRIGDPPTFLLLASRVPLDLRRFFIGVAFVGIILLLITFFRNRKKYTF